MATEDFTTYTEVDTPGKLTVTASTCSFADLENQENAYLYSDKGAGYFSGDFEHHMKFELTAYANSANKAMWALSNNIGRYNTLLGFNGLFVAVYGFTVKDRLFLAERYGGISYYDYGDIIALSTPYYLKIVRDESVGTYGTIYCYVYSDEAMTVLVDTLTVTLHDKLDFRYIYGFAGGDIGTYKGTGYTANLVLDREWTTLIPGSSVDLKRDGSISPTPVVIPGASTRLMRSGYS